jgi:outer membrane protein assembly factor BamB
VIWLILSVGCRYEPECTLLRPFEDLRNHTAPFEVALQVEQRRVYASSLSSPTVVEIDADTGQVVDVHVMSADTLVNPEVAVDDQGVIWLQGTSGLFLARYDSATDAHREYTEPLVGATGTATVPGGGVLVSGRLSDESPALLLIDATGEPGEPIPLAIRVRGLVTLGEQVALLHDTTIGGLEVRSLPELALLETCDLPFSASRGARLDDGTWVLTHGAQIAVVPCDGTEAQDWLLGKENHDPISLGDRALVLERLGDPDQGFDLNFGVAREVTRSGVVDPPLFATAKNAGFGVWDPMTDLLWVNSEGTAEIWALNAQDGSVVHTVRTGTFLDGLAIDPESTNTVFATGRLSNTVVRIQDEQLTATNQEIFWPYSPHVDVDRERLWVWSQADARVIGLDRETLEVLEVWDPGLGPNALLTFGSLVYHPGRRTLFVADSQSDVLLEWNPDTGVQVNRWALGGPSITDPDAIGELLIRVDSETDAILVARSNDARVQRILPDQATVTTVFLGDVIALALRDGNAEDFARVSLRDRALDIGGTALDVETLQRRSELDLEASRFLGPHPHLLGQRLVIDPERREIWRVDASDHTVQGSLGFAARDLTASVFRIDGPRNAVVMTRVAEAYICPFDAREIDCVGSRRK